MSDFLKKVHRAVEAMGEAPYDDQKTFEAVSKATKELENLEGFQEIMNK